VRSRRGHLKIDGAHESKIEPATTATTTVLGYPPSHEFGGQTFGTQVLSQKLSWSRDRPPDDGQSTTAARAVVPTAAATGSGGVICPAAPAATKSAQSLMSATVRRWGPEGYLGPVRLDGSTASSWNYSKATVACLVPLHQKNSPRDLPTWKVASLPVFGVRTFGAIDRLTQRVLSMPVLRLPADDPASTFFAKKNELTKKQFLTYFRFLLQIHRNQIHLL
jgi:hypothetical protein